MYLVSRCNLDWATGMFCLIVWSSFWSPFQRSFLWLFPNLFFLVTFFQISSSSDFRLRQVRWQLFNGWPVHLITFPLIFSPIFLIYFLLYFLPYFSYTSEEISQWDFPTQTKIPTHAVQDGKILPSRSRPRFLHIFATFPSSACNTLKYSSTSSLCSAELLGQFYFERF